MPRSTLPAMLRRIRIQANFIHNALSTPEFAGWTLLAVLGCGGSVKPGADAGVDRNTDVTLRHPAEAGPDLSTCPYGCCELSPLGGDVCKADCDACTSPCATPTCNSHTCPSGCCDSNGQCQSPRRTNICCQG